MVMTKSILVAYDGTATAERAFSKALALAARDGACLHIRTVIPSTKSIQAVADNKCIATDVWRRALLDRAHDKRVDAAFETVSADSTAKGIASEASRLRVDLIVVGHRHRQLNQKWLDTSVATRVVDHALCDVLVVT